MIKVFQHDGSAYYLSFSCFSRRENSENSELIISILFLLLLLLLLLFLTINSVNMMSMNIMLVIWCKLYSFWQVDDDIQQEASPVKVIWIFCQEIFSFLHDIIHDDDKLVIIMLEYKFNSIWNIRVNKKRLNLFFSMIHLNNNHESVID